MESHVDKEHRRNQKAQKATERARDALLRGRYEEAQKQVTRALEICPNCAIALTLQGIMKIEGKNYAEAAQTFRQAINADPTLGVAYLGLGQLTIRWPFQRGTRSAGTPGCNPACRMGR